MRASASSTSARLVVRPAARSRESASTVQTGALIARSAQPGQSQAWSCPGLHPGSEAADSIHGDPNEHALFPGLTVRILGRVEKLLGVVVDVHIRYVRRGG